MNGIGGFRLGLSAAGGECVFSNEWDKFSRATYQEWFGEVPDENDIRLLPLEKIPPHDVLAGGFPCQPFSLAGVSKKNSLGKDHGFRDANQGNLFLRIMEIVHFHRPPVVFLENVKNILSHDKRRTWSVITAEFDAADYELHFTTMSAEHWVPQRRERVFMVALDRRNPMFTSSWDDHETFPTNFVFPQPPEGRPTLGTILERKVDQKYTLNDHLWDYLQAYSAKHRALGNGFGFSVFGKNDVTRTLSARYHKDGSEILIDQGPLLNPRRLTPREAARLMGFDMYFASRLGRNAELPIVVSDTQAYRQFGNSVSPYVIEAIGKEISKILS